MLRVYGIKNCSTVKKALNWLDDNQLEYTFHDFKKEPATQEKLESWEKEVSWELLLNKRGTTWRKLTDEQQSSVKDASSANILLLENNSMIKRPIIESKKGILVGFDETEYKAKLK
ncbi:ArsC family reductase [Sphingobacterium sp. UT-1RO-CII-1]|uniref:ArsC family reductase n=1 Tax=Sphingobacterium sp. UT-1RO-CII-1 TaxID=2995225 RepID=UPI00227A9883|nr:ArsC family reductase [Sphingobacterium sp. UT-1RO-CII-1]MCY4780443.1 ArsC family reductase [Sphingobacterium sp. UT-1RO-CII-1]